jgi:subtilase family serine protease
MRLVSIVIAHSLHQMRSIAKGLDFMLSQPNKDLPGVVTTSYGDDEWSVPFDYATRVCNKIAQLTARGVSVIFSSGDGGVGGFCFPPSNLSSHQFSPDFPTTCSSFPLLSIQYITNRFIF